jgi:hypothetical protein
MSRDRREEPAAQRVVEIVDQVRLVPTDVPGAPDGTCDFAIERGGIVVGALEVTMLLDFSRQSLQGWIAKYGFVETSDLTRSWYVAFDDDALDMKKSPRFTRTLIKALAALEAARIEYYERPRTIRPGGSPVLIENMPVLLANSYETADVARVQLLGPSLGGVAWAGNTHAAIEEALAGERFDGEREKLRRAGGSERHLFVWIGNNLIDAELGLTLEDKPYPGAPSLGKEITTIWVAAPSPEGTILWRSAGEPWARHVVLDPR